MHQNESHLSMDEDLKKYHLLFHKLCKFIYLLMDENTINLNYLISKSN